MCLKFINGSILGLILHCLLTCLPNGSLVLGQCCFNYFLLFMILTFNRSRDYLFIYLPMVGFSGRSMVEVSYRSYNGSIFVCRVHDLLRDLAIEKAEEDNFLTVCSKPDEEKSRSGARRVATHFNSSELIKYASPGLRTLLCFKSPLPNCSEHKILKVLSLSNVARAQRNFTKTGQESFGGMTQLRYLRLNRDTDIDNPTRFVKLISNMKFLQTLDLRNIKTCDLSDFTWDIETLRHVMLPRFSLGPPSEANLRQLQTLTGIKNRVSWGSGAFPHLPNLSLLDIKIADGFSWEVVIAFLHTLKNLVILGLKRHEIPMEIIDMRGFPFYQQLTYMLCDGKFFHAAKFDLDVVMFPTHLTMLKLFECRIHKDLIAVLEKLHDLKVLWLINGIDEDLKQMRCSVGGFPRLEKLSVHNIKNLEEWEIEESAMPMLQKLDVQLCPMLKVPLGLKHLARLRNLSWSLYGDQSATTKAEELRNLCSHVPDLDISEPSGAPQIVCRLDVSG
jgi:disease resistance protein RPM1